MASLLALAVSLVLLLAPRGAHAVGEDECQLGAVAGYAAVKADGREPHGAIGALDFAYGLTDTWALRAAATFSLHPVSANEDRQLPGGRVQTRLMTVGFTYTLDVLRLVPYFNAGVGVLSVGGDVTRALINPAVELGIGADYFVNRRWTVGFITAYTFAPADLASLYPDAAGSSYTFVFGVRGSRTF